MIMFETRGVKFETVIKHMHLQTCIASEAVSIASVSPMNCSQIYKTRNKEKVSHSKRSTHACRLVMHFCFITPLMTSSLFWPVYGQLINSVHLLYSSSAVKLMG